MRARQLQSEGQSKAAISVLEPLVRPDAHALSDKEIGVVWILMGSSYEDLEMYDKARSCYETAAQKLRSIASEQASYAAAIENLASVESALGQMGSAKALCEKARRIYEGLGNHQGIVDASTDLALIAFSQKDFENARRLLARAFEEVPRATALPDDDMAALYSVNGMLAAHEGHYREAMADFGQSIARRIHAHGPNDSILGPAYTLRAKALAKSGDYPRAIADVEHALDILRSARGSSSPAYLGAEMVYAQILRASGAKRQATLIEKQAGNALANEQRRGCVGCTVSVESLR
jgi:tetratricopeptide (TPR) repeat protein